MTWLYVLAFKIAFVPLFAFAYWLVAIKGGNAIVKFLIPNQKIRDFLTKERYF